MEDTQVLNSVAHGLLTIWEVNALTPRSIFTQTLKATCEFIVLISPSEFIVLHFTKKYSRILEIQGLPLNASLAEL